MQIRLIFSLLYLPFFVCVMFFEGSLLAKRQNVFFILADDLGWAELGCYGNQFNETPNLDRLAKGGTPTPTPRRRFARRIVRRF